MDMNKTCNPLMKFNTDSKILKTSQRFKEEEYKETKVGSPRIGIENTPKSPKSLRKITTTSISSPKASQDPNSVIIKQKTGITKIAAKSLGQTSEQLTTKETTKAVAKLRQSSLDSRIKSSNKVNDNTETVPYFMVLKQSKQNGEALIEDYFTKHRKLVERVYTTDTKVTKVQKVPLKEKEFVQKTVSVLTQHTPSKALKEGFSENEKRRISLYFRNKVPSLVRAIDEKIRGVGSKVKTSKPKANILPAAEDDASKENQQLDEIWKILKVMVSTKSKYKYRDFVHYQRKLREAIKNLLPHEVDELSKHKDVLAGVNLEDESHSKPVTKGPKPLDPSKAHLVTEFLYKKKENPKAKIFIITGGYEALRRALLGRGWIENPDPSSADFDLKWCSKLELKFEHVFKPKQLVNHFEKSTVLTTKAGLARSIRNLIWFGNNDVDEFYPRCYDLNDAGEFDDYLEDFKFDQVTSILRVAKNKPEISSPSENNLFKLKLSLALFISERRLRPFETLIHDLVKGENTLITQEEWELLNVTMEDLDFALQNPKYEKILKSLKRRYNVQFTGEATLESDKSLLLQVEATLLRLEKEFPQLTLNQGKNIWIIKPAGLSRGRGICCYNTLPSILNHIQIKESEWVAQKYIENPLIIKNRKFDIRQWVLVTDFSPLTIFFYTECYVRFGAQDFNKEDLNNKFAHLTNNAIGKHAQNFETSEIEGNMWDSNEFTKYLQEVSGKDIFNEVIHPQMKNIVIKSLQSAHELALPSKNTFELYGYDFMIDENYKAWLIEINSSPSMDYSTSVTERMVKMVLEDCVKVVVDFGAVKNKPRKGLELGKFECIHTGKDI